MRGTARFTLDPLDAGPSTTAGAAGTDQEEWCSLPRAQPEWCPSHLGCHMYLTRGHTLSGGWYRRRAQKPLIWQRSVRYTWPPSQVPPWTTHVLSSLSLRHWTGLVFLTVLTGNHVCIHRGNNMTGVWWKNCQRKTMNHTMECRQSKNVECWFQHFL